MRLLQFSIRKLLIVVALVALYFPSEQLYRWWLATNHGYSYVEAVLHSELRAGDSFDQVAQHFDAMRLLTPVADGEYLKNLAAVCSAKGLAVLEGDEFFHVSVKRGSGAYLQFRNRRLVNLWNSTYIDARKDTSPPPMPFARQTFLAIYASAALFVLIAETGLTKLRATGAQAR